MRTASLDNYIALVLVLAAAGLHALWNVILHDVEDRLAAVAVAGLIGGCALLPAVVMAPPFHVLPLIGLSALAEIAYALCLSAAYRRGALSLTYPVGRGTAPLLVTLGGWALLTQPATFLTLGGGAALAVGLILIATTSVDAVGRAALGFSLLTGVTIAAYSLIDAHAVRAVSPVAYLSMVLLIEGGVMAVGIRCASGSWDRVGGALRQGSTIAAGSTGAYLLVLLAFQRSGAGRVATLRESSVLIGLLLSRERVGWRAWAGVTLVVAGAVLAAL